MQDAQPAFVVPDGQGGALVHLETPAAGVAPGQACVLYDGTRVLGSATVGATSRDALNAPERARESAPEHAQEYAPENAFGPASR